MDFVKMFNILLDSSHIILLRIMGVELLSCLGVTLS